MQDEKKDTPRKEDPGKDKKEEETLGVEPVEDRANPTSLDPGTGP